MSHKNWQVAIFGLGMGCGVFYHLLCSSIPAVQTLELYVQDALMRMRSRSLPTASQEIVLVEIDRRDLENKNFSLDRLFFANLASRLLEAKASVLVLNLRNNWRSIDEEYPIEITEKLNSPLKQLIKNHSDRLVLVTPTSAISPSKPSEFSLYNHLLPFDSNTLQSLIPPDTIQGFFEYEVEAQKPASLSSTARRIHLLGKFFLAEKLDRSQNFKSAFILALEKHKIQQKRALPPQLRKFSR